jgi:hypothetical protein
MEPMKPPTSLKRQGKKLWEDTVDGWEIVPNQAILLENLCHSQDRIADYQKILAEEGYTSADRFGVIRPHPIAILLKAELASFARLYRALNLETPGGDGENRPGRRDGFQPET